MNLNYASGLLILCQFVRTDILIYVSCESLLVTYGLSLQSVRSVGDRGRGTEWEVGKRGKEWGGRGVARVEHDR